MIRNFHLSLSDSIQFKTVFIIDINTPLFLKIGKKLIYIHASSKMFKLETQNDVIQRQAIERRKKLDNERKMRIFDPKTRLLGIDVKALEEQIKIKKEQADLEAARENAFSITI